jgi:predicted nucleic acid-binding protein
MLEVDPHLAHARRTSIIARCEVNDARPRRHRRVPRGERWLRELLRSRRYELLLVEHDVLDGAVDAIERFADKSLSFTDCTSFETIDRLGLEAAFSFDRDFRDCGYRMVP